MNSTHEQRIIEELKAVGVTHHGLAKPESKELPHILHKDEHIGGVIYGRGEGNNSAMLVATDRRVLFLDNQFLFKTADELSYDIVSGVTSSTAGPLTSVILHTRIADYALRYVNANCAKTFIKYIENMSLEKNTDTAAIGNSGQTAPSPLVQGTTDKKAEDFLKAHDLAVFSTVDRTGNVHGAVVYYTVDQNNTIYILTKSDTGKGKNVYAHSQVAMTVHEPGTLKTLQIQGMATIETDQRVKEDVFVRLTQPRMYTEGSMPPPVTRLQEGAYITVKITPLLMSYHDYAKN